MIFISRTSEIELGHFSQFKNDKLKGQDTRHYHWVDWRKNENLFLLHRYSIENSVSF